MTTDNTVTDQTPAPKPTQPSIFDQMDVNPITNEVVIPIAEVPASVIEAMEPETEVGAEKESPPDPFSSPAPEVKESGLSDLDRQELEYLRTQRSVTQQAKAEQERNAEYQKLGQQYMAEYQAKGLDQELAREFAADKAKVYIDANQRAQTEIDETREKQQFDGRKGRAATHFSNLYGVDRNALLAFNDQAEMEEFAKERQLRIKDKENYEKRLNSLETGKIEDGAYDSASSGAAPLNVAQLLAASADPDFVLTPAQQKQISQHLGLDT